MNEIALSDNLSQIELEINPTSKLLGNQFGKLEGG